MITQLYNWVKCKVKNRLDCIEFYFDLAYEKIKLIASLLKFGL